METDLHERIRKRRSMTPVRHYRRGGWFYCKNRAIAVKDTLKEIIEDAEPLVVLQILLTLGVTHLCVVYDVQFGPGVMTAMVFPIVFPLVFSINQAHTRRQTTLDNLAMITSALWTFHAFHNQWVDFLNETNPELGDNHCAAVFDNITRLIGKIREFCVQDRFISRNRSLEKVYVLFRELRSHIPKLRDLLERKNKQHFSVSHSNGHGYVLIRDTILNMRSLLLTLSDVTRSDTFK